MTLPGDLDEITGSTSSLDSEIAKPQRVEFQ